MTSNGAAGYFNSGLPYNRLGHGPRTLVVFQGLLFENKPMSGMMARYWPGRYRFLEDEYTTWIVTRRPGLPAGYTLRDMSEDYATTVREEFGMPVDVIGMSTGGSIAQHFAADHPALVRKLVLHSAAHELSEDARQGQLHMADLARRRRWRSAYVVGMDFMLPRRGLRRSIVRPALWTIALLVAWLSSPSDPSDLIVTIEAEDRHHFKSRLPEISVPTLVVAGTEDPYYSRTLFRETAVGIPQAELALYEGMGHPVSGERFERDVRAFLDAKLHPTPTDPIRAGLPPPPRRPDRTG